MKVASCESEKDAKKTVPNRCREARRSRRSRRCRQRIRSVRRAAARVRRCGRHAADPEDEGSGQVHEVGPVRGYGRREAAAGQGHPDLRIAGQGHGRYVDHFAR